MLYKKPKNDDKYQWTNHVVGKMVYYGISESLVKRVVRFPKRVEVGIAPGTTACMSPYGHASGRSTAGTRESPGKTQFYRGEVWVMYVEVGHGPTSNLKLKTQNAKLNQEQGKLQTMDYKLSTARKKIITTWRYPGISPIGKPIPIPEDILAELNQD